MPIIYAKAFERDDAPDGFSQESIVPYEHARPLRHPRRPPIRRSPGFLRLRKQRAFDEFQYLQLPRQKSIPRTRPPCPPRRMGRRNGGKTSFKAESTAASGAFPAGLFRPGFPNKQSDPVPPSRGARPVLPRCARQLGQGEERAQEGESAEPPQTAANCFSWQARMPMYLTSRGGTRKNPRPRHTGTQPESGSPASAPDRTRPAGMLSPPHTVSAPRRRERVE